MSQQVMSNGTASIVNGAQTEKMNNNTLTTVSVPFNSKNDEARASSSTNVGNNETDVTIEDAPVVKQVGYSLRMERNVNIYDPVLRYLDKKLNVYKSPFSTRLYKISKPKSDETSSAVEKALNNSEILEKENLDRVQEKKDTRRSSGRDDDDDDDDDDDQPEEIVSHDRRSKNLDNPMLTTNIHILSSDDETDGN